MYSSLVPPLEAWDEVEEEHLRSFSCTHDDLPFRLFCGRQAVAISRYGPRCVEHLEPEEGAEPS